MAIGKDEVVDVLSDFRLRSIRFSAGAINVNVEEYDRVADFVDSGAITIKPTKGVSMYDPPSDTLYLKDGDWRSNWVKACGKAASSALPLTLGSSVIRSAQYSARSGRVFSAGSRLCVVCTQILPLYLQETSRGAAICLMQSAQTQRPGWNGVHPGHMRTGF